MNQLTVGTYTGIQNASADINVIVKNRMTVVTGTDAPVKVFTVSGSEVDAYKALNPDIYIVKVAGKTVKLVVR